MFVAIPCAGHNLNLAVQHVPELRTALGRGKKVVKHFCNSQLDNKEHKVKQKQFNMPFHCHSVMVELNTGHGMSSV